MLAVETTHLVEPAARGWLDIAIRPVAPEDAARLATFFRTLSPAARHSRFLGVVNEVPSSLLARFVDPDGESQVAVAAATRGGSLVGDARYVVDGESESAEFAVAVADLWHGCGVGSRLLAALLRRARAQRLDALYGDVLPDNRAMLALARKYGFRERRNPSDPRLLRVEKSLA